MGATFIIQGVNSRGQVFRPTDWAERLAGRLCQIQMRRLRYSPYLYPTVFDANRALYVDGVLEEKSPHLYADLQAFARDNDLVVLRVD